MTTPIIRRRDLFDQKTDNGPKILNIQNIITPE